MNSNPNVSLHSSTVDERRKSAGKAMSKRPSVVAQERRWSQFQELKDTYVICEFVWTCVDTCTHRASPRVEVRGHVCCVDFAGLTWQFNHATTESIPTSLLPHLLPPPPFPFHHLSAPRLPRFSSPPPSLISPCSPPCRKHTQIYRDLGTSSDAEPGSRRAHANSLKARSKATRVVGEKRGCVRATGRPVRDTCEQRARKHLVSKQIVELLEYAFSCYYMKIYI